MAKQKSAVDIAAEQRAREQAEVEQAFLKGVSTLRDLIAPSSIEIHASYLGLAQNMAERYTYMAILVLSTLVGLVHL